jgi:N-methylhydantoinase B/oxoprolinase/acetone carboxylase alpha subunit
MSVDRMSLDPAALSVLIARLSGIAEEMGAVLRRGAYSPNIKERADCSAAVFDAQGAMLAQAEHIPVHLGSMPASVAAVIEALGELGPGEQAVVNDPFAGGTHLNDITVVAPCWQRGRLVGWVANRAHHADVGGAAPGSLPADATDVHQEGLRIPPTRLTDELRQLILANSRTPAERAGDLDAQVGANVVGIARLAALAAPPFGEPAPFDEVVAYGERRCRAALGALADGEWSAEDQMDSTGSADEQQRPARLHCTVRVRGERIEFDFTGTDAQRSGNTNAVRAVTESAVAFALRSVIDPGLPATAGTMAPVSIITEPGTLVDARYPAAVGAGNVEVSQRVVDVVCRALAEALPHRVGAASQGTMNNVLIGGDGPSGHWVYYETVAGGQGGRPPRPGVPGAAPTAGMSGVHTGMTNTDQVDYRSGEPCPGQSGIHTAMTNTRNTPIEALERAFPLRVLRYRLRWGSGGAGWSAGGEGIERDLQVLEDATVSLITERRVSRPWGLVGGGHGSVGENWLLPGGDESRAERLPDKCTIQLRAGDVVRMLTPGGGGWGAAAATRTGRQGSSPLRSA